LGFLGSRPFRFEDPAFERWILLDFLGFSRPNPGFSMGYADFRGTNFSRALSWRREVPGMGAGGRGHAEAQDCSWGKLNPASDFLQ
jgi:hypothetical protein